MPSATALPVAAAPAAQPDLPDEILENIFLRLDDPADLARASASCTSFHRVVSERRFLRRFRSLHAPPVLGFLDCSHGDGIQFYQAQPPHRAAPAARAVARSGDFTFSFLADRKRWCVSDARDGRILLARTKLTRYVFDVFVVYDPLHRRHVWIPPVPDDLLLASTARCSMKHGYSFTGSKYLCTEQCDQKQHFEPFLAPAGEEEAETSLQVICIVFSNSKVVSFVYSSVIGKWRCAASFETKTFPWIPAPILLTRHYAHSCFFWTGFYETGMLVLDTREMKIFDVYLPLEGQLKNKTIVEVDKVRLGLFIVDECELNLYTTAWQGNSVGRKDWEHYRIICLSDYTWSFSRGACCEGYILLRGVPRVPFSFRTEKKPDAHYLTVEVKTLSVEPLCVLKYETNHDYLYASFPPPLSLPTI